MCFLAFIVGVCVMLEQYIGEIRMFRRNFAPEGWALCNGQLLLINDNQALFPLINNIWGDGTTNFALPNLRGRLPIHKSSQYPLASTGGVEAVTLTTCTHIL